MTCNTAFQLSFEGEFDLRTVMEHLSRHVQDGERVRITLAGVILNDESPSEPSSAAE